MSLKIPRPSPQSIWLYMGGFACLAITALMNRHAGVSQGATEEGRQLLGAGAIIIDIVGIVLFGSIAGNLLARGKKWLGGAVLVVMISCAAFSISSIMSFVASEWLSVAESRRAADKLGQERRATAEIAAKERRALQAELAKQHLKTLEGTSISKGGRQERRELRKDMNTAASDLIAKVGQAQDAPPEAVSEGISIRPDGGAEIISWMTSLPERTVQVTRMAALAVLLIVLKAFAFPLGGFYWSHKPSIGGIGAELPRSTNYNTPPLPIAEAVVTVRNGSNNGSAPPQMATPAEIHSALLARLDRPPLPEAIPALQGFGFPVTGKPKGEMRKVFSSPKGTAQNFVTWLQAYDLAGTYTPDELVLLYKEFARRDHREETSDNFLRDALSRLGKRNGIQRLDSFKGERKRRWVVYPGRFSKQAAKAPPLAAGAETQPGAPAGAGAPQSGQVVRFRPFGEGAQAWGHNAVALVREQKLAWQRRSPNRKSLNRLSRARSA